ncbi:GNAT family N-acetyltransferase [Vagococcus bubulae]|uniref:GNAT family N-acetyltransferase n=1 Tax=Vagococcus bubulae TaxID=1977868 RepID=A0A429ZA60_9ENTE|nr:GNAT family N-acetyltransferase [Vagococcus bubulae]RST90582.1 GNAT family N-acetyltransferase [Vagococcus bubulae]
MRWDSAVYKETLNLRNDVLRKSAGKPLLVESPKEERTDIHLVIKQDGKVVGTLLLHPCFTSCVQIKQVAISPTCQGQGLGKKLMVYAEDVAKRLGYSTIFLTGRQSAWNFYRKLGYSELMDDYVDGDLVFKVFKKEIQTVPIVKEMKTNG